MLRALGEEKKCIYVFTSLHRIYFYTIHNHFPRHPPTYAFVTLLCPALVQRSSSRNYLIYYLYIGIAWF